MGKGALQIVLDWKRQVVRTVVPKTVGGRMGFIAIPVDPEIRIKEAKGWGDDNMEGDDYEISILTLPLKVVLGCYLNGR